MPVLRHTLLCSGRIGFQQLVQQLVHGIAVLRHSFLQVVFGKVVVAQQLGYCHMGIGDFLYDFQIVAGIIVRAFVLYAM